MIKIVSISAILLINLLFSNNYEIYLLPENFIAVDINGGLDVCGYFYYPEENNRREPAIISNDKIQYLPNELKWIPKHINDSKIIGGETLSFENGKTIADFTYPTRWTPQDGIEVGGLPGTTYGIDSMGNILVNIQYQLPQTKPQSSTSPSWLWSPCNTWTQLEHEVIQITDKGNLLYKKITNELKNKYNFETNIIKTNNSNDLLGYFTFKNGKKCQLISFIMKGECITPLGLYENREVKPMQINDLCEIIAFCTHFNENQNNTTEYLIWRNGEWKSLSKIIYEKNYHLSCARTLTNSGAILLNIKDELNIHRSAILYPKEGS